MRETVIGLTACKLDVVDDTRTPLDGFSDEGLHPVVYACGINSRARLHESHVRAC